MASACRDRLEHPLRGHGQASERGIVAAAATVATPTQGRPEADDGDNDTVDLVDEWGRQSFPASDPPQNW